MPGPLDHSPADILRSAMILHNLGSFPSGISNAEWSIFVDNEPDRPDSCATIYNTSSRQQGRTQTDGEIQEMHGIQVRIRAALSKEAYAKARQIAIELDEGFYQENVTIGSSVYCIHSFSRTSDVIPSPGKDTPTPTKRTILTFNGLLTVRQQVTGTGTYF